jgi:hypothetical protein
MASDIIGGLIRCSALHWKKYLQISFGVCKFVQLLLTELPEHASLQKLITLNLDVEYAM